MWNELKNDWNHYINDDTRLVPVILAKLEETTGVSKNVQALGYGIVGGVLLLYWYWAMVIYYIFSLILPLTGSIDILESGGTESSRDALSFWIVRCLIAGVEYLVDQYFDEWRGFLILKSILYGYLWTINGARTICDAIIVPSWNYLFEADDPLSGVDENFQEAPSHNPRSG